MIVIGYVLFFKETNSFISRVIANITNSEFTHVGLIIAHDELTGVATIIESNRFIKTRIKRIQLDERHFIFRVDMTDEVRDKVVKYAHKSLGEKYDYLQIVGLFISLISKGTRLSYFDSKNKLICSELIDLAYYKAGVPRKNIGIPVGNITPKELLEVYDFKEGKEV